MGIKLSSLNKGLVGSWNLDSESMKSSVIFGDKTPNNNDGVSTNAPVFVADRFGNTKAIRLNGTDDCIRIPDSASLIPTSTMTAMVWVKGTTQSTKGILSHFDGGNNQISFLLYTTYTLPYNKINILISEDGTTEAGHQKRYTSSIVVFNSTWHLIGFSFNAGTLKIFIDGIEDTNPTKINDDAITTIHDSTADVMVGCYLNSDTPTGFFTGDIAEPRIYNRALSTAEITSLAQQYRSKVMI